MYLADAFGYLGYVVVMFSRKLFFGRENFLDFFTMACGVYLGKLAAGPIRRFDLLR